MSKTLATLFRGQAPRLALFLFATVTMTMSSLAGPQEDGIAAFWRRDYSTALRLLLPLAKQGAAESQVVVGTIYVSGLGVPQDLSEAMRWYRLAADQGNSEGQADLGLMYEYGQGVTQDLLQAMKWYRLAAAQGNRSGEDRLDELSDKMAADSLADVGYGPALCYLATSEALAFMKQPQTMEEAKKLASAGSQVEVSFEWPAQCPAPSMTSPITDVQFLRAIEDAAANSSEAIVKLGSETIPPATTVEADPACHDLQAGGLAGATLTQNNFLLELRSGDVDHGVIVQNHIVFNTKITAQQVPQLMPQTLRLAVYFAFIAGDWSDGAAILKPGGAGCWFRLTPPAALPEELAPDSSTTSPGEAGYGAALCYLATTQALELMKQFANPHGWTEASFDWPRQCALPATKALVTDAKYRKALENVAAKDGKIIVKLGSETIPLTTAVSIAPACNEFLAGGLAGPALTQRGFLLELSAGSGPSGKVLHGAIVQNHIVLVNEQVDTMALPDELKLAVSFKVLSGDWSGGAASLASGGEGCRISLGTSAQ